MTHSRRTLLLLSIILVLAVGEYGTWRWPFALPTAWFGTPTGAGRPTVSGNIEAHESVLSFTQVQAPIVELPFDEGATVAHDAVLARVDDRLYRQQVEIDLANQQVATAQVAVNQSNLLAA